MSFNQNKYIDEYNKTKYKMYQFRIKRSDVDLINKLDSIENRNNYIKDLLNNNVFTLKEIKNRIKPIFKKYEINEIYLFGSYARGEANYNSDVDIYCNRGNINTLIEEVELIDNLEKALNKKVDIVFMDSQMNEFFRNQLKEDLIKLC